MRLMPVLAVTLALAFAPTAGSALDLRLAVSTTAPRVGEEVHIWLFPYWPYLDGEAPAAVDYPFRIQALGPGRLNLLVRATRTNNPYVWRARFVFRKLGRWEIRWVNAYFSERLARLGIGYPPTAPRVRLVVKA
jgi:hypothetical protein